MLLYRSRPCRGSTFVVHTYMSKLSDFKLNGQNKIRIYFTCISKTRVTKWCNKSPPPPSSEIDIQLFTLDTVCCLDKRVVACLFVILLHRKNSQYKIPISSSLQLVINESKIRNYYRTNKDCISSRCLGF